MRNFTYLALLILGGSQVILGAILGRLRIYALKAPLLHDLGLAKDQIKTFSRYMDVIANQWQIVCWLGIFTVSATLLLIWDDRHRARKNSPS
jgi:ABC-type branched-subunit amino acid transport system permease subunit